MWDYFNDPLNDQQAQPQSSQHVPSPTEIKIKDYYSKIRVQIDQEKKKLAEKMCQRAEQLKGFVDQAETDALERYNAVKQRITTDEPVEENYFRFYYQALMDCSSPLGEICERKPMKVDSSGNVKSTITILTTLRYLYCESSLNGMLLMVYSLDMKSIEKAKLFRTEFLPKGERKITSFQVFTNFEEYPNLIVIATAGDSQLKISVLNSFSLQILASMELPNQSFAWHSKSLHKFHQVFPGLACNVQNIFILNISEERIYVYDLHLRFIQYIRLPTNSLYPNRCPIGIRIDQLNTLFVFSLKQLRKSRIQLMTNNYAFLEAYKLDYINSICSLDYMKFDISISLIKEYLPGFNDWKDFVAIVGSTDEYQLIKADFKKRNIKCINWYGSKLEQTVMCLDMVSDGKCSNCKTSNRRLFDYIKSTNSPTIWIYDKCYIIRIMDFLTRYQDGF